MTPGIISPPPISTRGPLPPLQRVPLPVPPNNKPEPIPKSYPQSFNNDINHSENNHIITDIPQNPNDHEIVNENSSVLSVRLQSEPKENRFVKDFEATSLNGSVTIENSPQHSANRVSRVKQCKIQCFSTNDKVDVLSTTSDGDDVVYVIGCNGWNDMLDHQVSNELNKNLNNTDFKLWLEGLADEISDSSGSFRGNKHTDKVHSAVKSDEDLINNRTFSIKQNSGEENTSGSEVLPSDIRDRFPYKCLPDVIQTKDINDQICFNNSVKKVSVSYLTPVGFNLPNQCGDSTKSVPNFYKYFPPKKILNFSECDKIRCGKTHLSSSVETCKEETQLSSKSERECDCTTEEEEVVNVINSTASSVQFSNRAKRNLCKDWQAQGDVNFLSLRNTDKATLKSPVNSYLKISKKKIKPVNNDTGKCNEIVQAVNVFNMSKQYKRNSEGVVNCQNLLFSGVKQNVFEKEVNFNKSAEINRHQRYLNRCVSLSRNVPEQGKSMHGVQSDFLLNCKSSAENDRKTCFENKYLMFRNENVCPRNGKILNEFNANNSFDIEMHKSEKNENNVDKNNRAMRNIFCGERLRGGEDSRYEEFSGLWKRIEMQDLKNFESNKLFIEVPEQSIEEEVKKMVPTEIKVQPAYSNNVEVENKISERKSQVRSGGLVRNFLTRTKRTPSLQSEDKISSANICDDLHEQKKTVDATTKAKSKLKSKMCTIL